MLQQVDRVEGLQRVNDFVVKFANVNGSGSASANSMFAKAVLRMGVASTPRNIFPSNIQGLPTWYEVRSTSVVVVVFFCMFVLYFYLLGRILTLLGRWLPLS